MAEYHLAPDIGFVTFGDCGIVLDVRADRYWQLDARLAEALDAVRTAPDTPIAVGDRTRLERLGLIVDASDPGSLPREAVASAVVSSALDASPARTISAGRLAAIWWMATLGWAEVKYGRLATALQRVRDRRRRRRPARGDVAQLARDFVRYRRTLPIQPVCLADSLAFLAIAARHGHYPDLVFGVTAHPFAAHCWVQTGDTVLTDNVDHVTVFRPILVV
jgi:hypothetical protein